MPTLNKEVTREWTLIATGPAEYISLDESRQPKYSPAQIALSADLPVAELQGHPVLPLTGGELDAGENLYARATGDRALLIITSLGDIQLGRTQNG